MKRKILFGCLAILFAAATAFNIGLLHTKDADDISLDAITIMAEAQNESALNAFINSVSSWWDSTIYDCVLTNCVVKEKSSYIGVGTGLGASASTSAGVTYKNGDLYPTTTTNFSVGAGISLEASFTTTYYLGTKEACTGGSKVAHCWECESCS